jgi:hypothetical protein
MQMSAGVSATVRRNRVGSGATDGEVKMFTGRIPARVFRGATRVWPQAVFQTSCASIADRHE